MKTPEARRIFLLIIFSLVCLLPGSSEAQENLSSNWWDSNRIIAKGHGSPPINAATPYEARNLSRRAALLDGYRNLAGQVRGVHITAETTIESQILSGDIVNSRVEAVIRDAEILSEEFAEDGSCTLVLSVPVFGVTDSLATAVFKPVAKEEFPLPSVNNIAQGNYTGLIIDCGNLNLNPVLSPVIRNADNLSIYSYSNLDYEKVISNGVVGYVKKDSGATSLSQRKTSPLSYTELIDKKLFLLTSSTSGSNISRAGDNPLIIKAESLSDAGSCPVVSTSDADRILAENQSSHFLDKGAVVFMSHRDGAIRI